MEGVSSMAKLRRHPNSVPSPPHGPRLAMEQNKQRWNLRVPPREYAPASMPRRSSLRGAGVTYVSMRNRRAVCCGFLDSYA